MATIISSKTTGGGGASITGDTSGILQLASADGTTAVTIDASQNVGIGTASPAQKLNISGTGSTYLRVDGTTNSGVLAYVGVNLVTALTDAQTVFAGGLTSDGAVSSKTNLTFGTNSTERMRIDSSGNVGIGTSSPAVPLQIGNGTASATLRFGATSNGFDIGRDNASGFFIQNATQASPYNQFIWQQSGTERMRIDSSGNLLVGTTTAYGGISTTSTIAPMATPSTNWGIDFAPSTSTPNFITLAAAATYDLANGSGIIVIHNNNNGDAAVFLTYGGNVVKLGGAASIVSGVGGASQIGLVYNGGAGKYRVNNGYATSQSMFISTIRTRTNS